MEQHNTRRDAEISWTAALYGCVAPSKGLRLLEEEKYFSSTFPTTIMPRNQFFAISSNIHISDPAEDVENEKKKGSKDYDCLCLHQLKPLLEMMRTRCMAFYHPRQNISVDERMVATKARLSIKQYMKEKPTKWGLKFFVLADGNGYTVDFKLYTSKNQVASGNGLSLCCYHIPHQQELPGISLCHELLHQPPPLPTLGPAGIWGLWHLQARESGCSIH